MTDDSTPQRPTMTDVSTPQRPPRPTRLTRPDIKLPNGEVLTPRARFAHEVLDVCDKTAARMNLSTTYIGGVAYVPRNASLKTVAEGARRLNQPTRRRV